MHAERAGVPLPEFPNIQGLFARIGALDAWKATNP